MKKLIFLMIIFLAILNNSYASTNSVTSSDGKVTELTISNDSSSGVSGGNPGNDGVACTMEYDPVCTEIDVCLPPNGTGGIINQMCRLGKQNLTYSNECLAKNAGARVLYKGECSKTGTGTKVCTQEAKLCSDGKTYVSRTGPNCEFSACPTEKCFPQLKPCKVGEPCESTCIPKACTQEAKLCSDGKTYVSRTGTNCEFSACPIVIGLSENIKSQLNVIVDKIVYVSKNQSGENLFIEKIISKLIDMKVSKPKLSRYIDYIISELQ